MNRRNFFTMLGASAALAYVPAALLSEAETATFAYFPNNEPLGWWHAELPAPPISYSDLICDALPRLSDQIQENVLKNNHLLKLLEAQINASEQSQRAELARRVFGS